jgi:hypothetical protein
MDASRLMSIQLGKRVATAAALLLLLGASIAGASTGWRVIAQASSGTSFGTGAVIPYLEVRRPHGLAIRVVADPNKPLRAEWTVLCIRGTRVVHRTSKGHFSWTSTSKPVFRVLRLPMTNPPRCAVSASVERTGFSTSGSFRLQLLKR